MTAAPCSPPRLHYGQQCPDCLHPWWAHRTREPARQLAKPVPDHCIGQDCHCTRLGPAPRHLTPPGPLASPPKGRS